MSLFGSILKTVAAPVVGGLFGSISGSQTNAASARAAAQANEFTKEQMQNRHQWEVDDLLKAGLNPVLSANGTPSMGGSAVADVINPADSAFRGVSSALETKRLGAELENIKADTEKKQFETYVNKNLGEKLSNEATLAEWQIKQLRDTLPFTVSNAKTQAALAAAGLPGAQTEARIDKSKYGQFIRTLQRMNPLAGTSAKFLAR